MVTFRQFKGLGKYTFNLKHAYRFDSFIWMTLISFFFIVEFFMWRSIFTASGQEVLRGFTFNQIVLYFMMSHITMTMTNSNVDRKLANLIKKGNLIRHVIRPMPYLIFAFLLNFWRSMLHLIMYVPPILIVGYILIPSVNFAVLQPGYYIISLMLANILVFTYIFSFGLTAFWLKEYHGMRLFRHGLAAFFTGMLLPLSFFPIFWQKLFFYMPFQYMVYVPIQIFLGHYEYNQMLLLIGMQAVWVFIFLAISVLVWKKAFKKFTGVGV